MERDEMRKHRLPLDRATADRLVAGALDPGDAPPGYERVAGALAELGRPAAEDTAGEVDHRLLAELVLAVESSPSPAGAPPRPRRLSAKVAAVAAGALVSATGVAAAATGNLPDPAQDAVARAADVVGLQVPTSGDDGPDLETGPAADARSRAADDATGRTPDSDDAGPGPTGGSGGPDAAQVKPPTGHADNPTDADDHGAAVSDTARTTEERGREKGAAVADAARSGQGGPAEGPGSGGAPSTLPDDDDQDDAGDDDVSEDETHAERPAGVPDGPPTPPVGPPTAPPAGRP